MNTELWIDSQKYGPRTLSLSYLRYKQIWAVKEYSIIDRKPEIWTPYSLVTIFNLLKSAKQKLQQTTSYFFTFIFRRK